MNRLRLSDVRDPVGTVMNVCATISGVTNPAIRSYANRAHRYLVNKGKFVGTVQRYRFCTTANCITLPRQVETVEAWQLCNMPGTVRNQWYEYNGQGPGLLKETSNWYNTLVDRGTAVAFDDIVGTTKKIQVVPALNEAVGARILLLGYDENGNWIRTQESGVWIDGEYVSCEVTTLSTNFFSTLTGVIKPTTNGPIRLYEYDTSTSTITKQLAYYENDEQVPIYRRYMVPGLSETNGCGDSSGCASNKVTMIVKLRHIDVTSDNDFFLLGNVEAIVLMVQAIQKKERNLFAEAKAYEADAVQALQDELSSYEGDGALPALKTEDRETWGAGVIPTIGSNNWGI